MFIVRKVTKKDPIANCTCTDAYCAFHYSYKFFITRWTTAHAQMHTDVNFTMATNLFVFLNSTVPCVTIRDFLFLHPSTVLKKECNGKQQGPSGSLHFCQICVELHGSAAACFTSQDISSQRFCRWVFLGYILYMRRYDLQVWNEKWMLATLQCSCSLDPHPAALQRRSCLSRLPWLQSSDLLNINVAIEYLCILASFQEDIVHVNV